jgi:putative bacteriocin precursor
MKKLGKKLQVNNETLRAYCGCVCVTGCTTKCNCSSTVAYNSLNTTNVSNVYSATGTASK